jgi:hypothetical protein
VVAQAVSGPKNRVPRLRRRATDGDDDGGDHAMQHQQGFPASEQVWNGMGCNAMGNVMQ